MASIDNLPPEVLEIIFRQLSLRDIGNCSQTCLRWNQIIKALFKDKAKIVITTGLPEEKGIKSEVIDLTNPCLKCDRIENIPKRWGSIGGVLKNQPLIGGGYVTDEYFRDYFVIGSGKRYTMMLEKRFAASSVVMKDETIWVVGGHDGYNELSSTEFLSIDQPPVRGPDLPFTISWHCMIQYDSNSIYIIGGKQEGTTSKKTWIANPSDNFKIKEGPDLKKARAYHCAGKMEVGGKNILVVAGGDSKSYLDSVEILDPTSNKGWVKGPKLPFKLSTSAMVPSPTGHGVVIIGGWNDSTWKYSTALLELHGKNIKTLKWIPLKQTLQHARVGHLAFSIPDFLVKETHEIQNGISVSTNERHQPNPIWKKVKKNIHKVGSFLNV